MSIILFTMSGERLQPNPQEAAGQTAAAPERKKRVSSRKRYATQETVYTGTNEEVGEILLRVEPGTNPTLPFLEKATFIQAAIDYAKTKGQIDELTEQIKGPETTFREFLTKYPGLTGIESKRLNTTVTGVTEVTLKPDVVEVRRALGNAFEEVGLEKITLTMAIPEGLVARGRKVTFEDIRDVISLSFMYLGMNEEEQRRMVDIQRSLQIKDRKKLLEHEKEGHIPSRALGRTKKVRLEVGQIQKTPKPAKTE